MNEVREIHNSGRNKQNIINEKLKNILLNEIFKIFGKENVVGILMFGSFVTGEDNIYSDYDLTIVLNQYEDENIYAREKASPILKKRF